MFLSSITPFFDFYFIRFLLLIFVERIE
uniref:Uncharacterized protein n=1 Tax=Rhizophora mucronata TaxID=61149 RepID=A0A2P2LQL1_RHIMU